MVEWEAYDELEPIGGFRQDYRFAQLCCLIADVAQAFGSKKGKRKKFSPSDFMPWGPRPEKPKRSKAKTPEEIKQLFQTIARLTKQKKAPERTTPPRIKGGVKVK